MNKKGLIFAVSVIGVLIIITVATLIKINEKNTDEEYDFIVDNFIFYSKQCVKEGNCENTIVTLKELYDNSYIKKQINPKTDDVFDEKSYIKMEDYEFVLVE